MANPTITIEEIVKLYSGDLRIIYMPAERNEIHISSADINRLGLTLAGFFDYFDEKRLQVMGMVEYSFLKAMSDEERYKRLDALLSKRIPALIITREIQIFPEILELAKKYLVPVLSTTERSSIFMASMIMLLNRKLAPRTTLHGVLLEIYGEGILITGQSGIGKSETAIELVKRGHRLVADDAVDVMRISDKAVVGECSENIRYYLELRGIGIVNVKDIFGAGAVKDSQRIDLVIDLETWDNQKVYNRLGIDDEITSVLGVDIPKVLLPVREGKNIAVIIEVAAMNNKQRRHGYNAAMELSNKIMEKAMKEG